MKPADPKLYAKCMLRGKNGEEKLYVKLDKSLYSYLRSALLFYCKLRGELESYGFVFNPYDPCVANKWVNGSHMTVAWYVDDLKISHVDEAEVQKLIDYLEMLYGKMNV